jgi:hypothetical protein
MLAVMTISTFILGTDVGRIPLCDYQAQANPCCATDPGLPREQFLMSQLTYKKEVGENALQIAGSI